MTVVKGLATNRVDFSGDKADSEAEEGTGGEPSRVAQEASTPAWHMVSGLYWPAEMDAGMVALSHHIWARALQEDPINLWQVSEVGKLQEEEEAVDPEPSSILAYQDSVCLKEQITCRQL